MRVSDSPIREDRDRDALSPVISHAALGNPSLITSAMTPMYVYESTVTTRDVSMLAIQYLGNVP